MGAPPHLPKNSQKLLYEGCVISFKIFLKKDQALSSFWVFLSAVFETLISLWPLGASARSIPGRGLQIVLSRSFVVEVTVLVAVLVRDGEHVTRKYRLLK